MTIIAIDGPSGSGKSSAARLLAQRLDFAYLDTGAMYRAVGYIADKKDIKSIDELALTKLATEIKIKMVANKQQDGSIDHRVIVNGVDVTLEIRTPEVTQLASSISVHPGVRERLVKRQRNWVEAYGAAVVEGRDIGTVVFPDADLKVFLTANPSERAKRRQLDEAAPGFGGLSEEEAQREIAVRDKRDSSRAASPLSVADDAWVIDTSNKTLDDVVTDIISELRKRMGGEWPLS